MRIVDVCGFYSPSGGGIRTYVDQKLRMAERLGYDVTIVAPGEASGTAEVSRAARIVTIPSPRFPLDRKYFAFTNERAVHAAIDALRPDVVEASSPWHSADYVARYPGGVPRSLIMHSEPLSAHAYRWLESVAEPPAVDLVFDWFWERLRRYGRAFDAVVAANHDLSARLHNGGVANVLTVPMGVEPGLFSPALRDEDVRHRLLAMCALGPDATLLVCAGRLATEKRVPMLVRAATLAGHERPVGLAIFGHGRTRQTILRAIGGNPHIRLFEPLTDRRQFATMLASADALFHGCEAETFGMIAAEAHASGLRVVAPDAGGAGDFARLDPGLAFHPTSARDAARAILRLPPPGVPKALCAPPRTMEDHFRELVDRYATLVAARETRAA